MGTETLHLPEAPGYHAPVQARLISGAVILGWACLLGGLLWVPFAAEREHRHPGDLLAYHAAGLALLAGENPTDFEVLSRRGASTPFVYPPTAWPFARLLATFDWPAAQRWYSLAKALAVIGLGLLWRGWFRARPLVFAITLASSLVGFRLALRIDLFTGNVATFEALCIWSALLLLRAGRPRGFVAALAVGSMWKLTPLALLPLAELSRGARRRIVGAVGIVALIGGVLVATNPTAWREALSAAAAIDERAPQNATVLALCRDVFGVGTSALFAWALTTLGVAVATWRWWPAGATFERRASLLLVTWALLLPRFKDYSFVVLLPVAVEALSGLRVRHWPVVAAFVVVFAVPVHPYQRLASLVLTWALLLVTQRGSSLNGGLHEGLGRGNLSPGLGGPGVLGPDEARR